MSEQTQPAARRSILLVDDDRNVRQTLTMLLRWAGDWEVVGEAADGERALALAAAHSPDVVLLDRWLEDGDGLRMVPRLCALARPPLVVMLTAEPDMTAQQQALAQGVAIWLDKLTPPLELLSVLRAAVVRPREQAYGLSSPKDRT